MQLQIAAKPPVLCCHLANTNEEMAGLATAIPPFAKLVLVMCNRSTVTNTMKELTCYSDFPMPGDFPNYLHHSKFNEYLRLYAKHFQLQQYIRFEVDVVSVEQELNDGEGRWTVTTRKTTSTQSGGKLICNQNDYYLRSPGLPWG